MRQTESVKHRFMARRGNAVESEVVEQRADRDDFRVVRYALQLSEPDREQPGSDSVVEEKRFRMLPRKLHCPADERRVDNRHAAQPSGSSPDDGRLGCG